LRNGGACVIISGFLFWRVIGLSVDLLECRRLNWLPFNLKDKIMKPSIHPEYREVVFHDMSCDFKFVTRSTVNSRETIEFEGKTYPLVKLETSSESHPFYTGTQKIIDTAGRVEKFRNKYGSRSSITKAAE
jgi:large subunit ribosomal protein L31